MLNDMTMHIPANPKTILGKVGGKHGDISTDSAKQLTIDCFITFWKTLRDFCFVIGDYRSAMIYVVMTVLTILFQLLCVQQFTVYAFVS
jgi:succinate-acetate transporter protein